MIKYGYILNVTNAHKRQNDVIKQIKSSKGYKYNNIIRKLFPSSHHKSTTSMLIGEPLTRKRFKTTEGMGLMRVTDNTNYVYWNSGDELVERLKVLIASQQVGNSNHQNEVFSIIEELKESGIIL